MSRQLSPFHPENPWRKQGEGRGDSFSSALLGICANRGLLVGRVGLPSGNRPCREKGENAICIIDYLGQFRALVQAGYSGTVSLETHWKGAGSAEESPRQSMAGMKDQLSKAGAV